MKPLAGIKVVDFSRVLAGPVCAQYLGDLGAEVIKVEALGHGDDTRVWPPVRSEGLGAMFLSFNRNKRSIVLDLKSEEGRGIARQLAARADVVVENFITGVADKLGVGEQALRAENPRLIYCSVSGYGRSGPLKNAPGYDVILQAFSGIMALTGEEGSGHIRSPISSIDQITAAHALSGVLAALLERHKTGRGATVKASLLESAIGLLGNNLQTFWERGVQPERLGSSHEALCPYQAFEASDGPLMIGVANDGLWRKFCAATGLEALVDDPKFRTNADRVRHRAETLGHVQTALARHTAAYWNEAMEKIGVPCSPIHSLEQMLAHPHVASTGMIVDYEHPAGGPMKAVMHPVLLDDSTRSEGLPPPLLGEHTDGILKELGLTPSRIDELRRAKVVA